jgi:hypothetical protein
MGLLCSWERVCSANIHADAFRKVQENAISNLLEARGDWRFLHKDNGRVKGEKDIISDTIAR